LRRYTSAQDCELLLLVRRSWMCYASSVKRISGKTCNRGHNLYKLADELLDLTGKWVVLVESGKVRNHHGAKFFLHLSVHHQSLRKLCVSLYLMPEHQLLHTYVLQVILSLKGRNQSHSDFCAHLRLLRVGVFATWETLLLFNYSWLRVSFVQTVWEMHVGISFIYKSLKPFCYPKVQPQPAVTTSSPDVAQLESSPS